MPDSFIIGVDYQNAVGTKVHQFITLSSLGYTPGTEEAVAAPILEHLDQANRKLTLCVRLPQVVEMGEKIRRDNAGDPDYLPDFICPHGGETVARVEYFWTYIICTLVRAHERVFQAFREERVFLIVHLDGAQTMLTLAWLAGAHPMAELETVAAVGVA